MAKIISLGKRKPIPVSQTEPNDKGVIVVSGTDLKKVYTRVNNLIKETGRVIAKYEKDGLFTIHLITKK